MARAYNDAFGACCGVKISPSVVAALDAASFRDISGCPTECDYAADGFPSADAPAPVVVGERDDDGNCVKPPGAGSLVAPSYFAKDSKFCNEKWIPLNAKYAQAYTDGCSAQAETDAAKLLAADLEAAAGSVEDQALAVRAFSVQGCSGDLNPVFTGNGFTATGLSGLYSATASEFITSPFNLGKLPRSAFATIYFCISGKNGGRPVDGKCEP